MTLSSGTSIGPYEILASVGAGGMGEVYRARDAKLGRDVALKVLPPQFTTEPNRLSRFRREAQVLAALNHPNIGHIYGFEDTGGVHALVLEFVEGPTLADRIAQGPMPLEEALSIARQIAEALECAHEQGIIHRDLKPANIKVRPDGTAKVLDFGLAKVFDPAAASNTEVMDSPTLTAWATQLGMILGTAAYMAPEQARGKTIDRRADIWAFGVVLFEMLTGKRAFESDDISITLASVLKDEVDWKALPPDLPTTVHRMLRRCLQKDPKRRLSAIADARLEIEEAAAIEPASTARGEPPRVSPGWKRWLPWAIAAAGLIAALIAWAPWRTPPRLEPLRLTTDIGVGEAATLNVTVAPAAVISPDGQTIVFSAAIGSNRPQLYVRRLSQLSATPLSGTEDGFGPFFSPDGQWIGFFAGASLRKVAVTGGAVMTLCPAAGGRGAWWGEDGAIVFQPISGPNATLHRVSDGGGTSAPIGVQADEETTQRWPQILPGGRGVLYSGNAGTAAWHGGSVMVQPLDGGKPKRVLRGGYHARYVPATGHLLYIQQATLFAAPFDVETLTVTGNGVPVVDGVLSAINTGGSQFSVSNSGTLVYVPGQGVAREAPIYLMDASGKTTIYRPTPSEWYNPRFSPDGRKLALAIGTRGTADIYIHEPESDLTKFTFEPGNDTAPVWTPDGTRIAFASQRPESGPLNIFWQRSNGTGGSERLTQSKNPQIPYSFHRSGKSLYLAFTEQTQNNDIMILPLSGDDASGWKPGTPWGFLQTPFNETAPMFSPDGRWLAYMSPESGIPEIYVRPFPSNDYKRKISTAGGVFPKWSRKRDELFYLVQGPPDRVMVVPYRVEGASFVSGVPKPWSPQDIMQHGGDTTYDVHPDGDRIVMLKPPERAAQERDKAVFVVNFFDELRRVAPAGR